MIAAYNGIVRGLATSLLLFGCYNAGHSGSGSDGGGDGAHAPDAPVMQVNVDAAPGDTCYGFDDGVKGIVRVCVPTPTANSTALINSSFSTASSPQCVAAKTTRGTPVCVISADNVMVGNARPTGPVPLVIAGTTVTISGLLDISGHAGTSGAGAGSCSGGAGGPDTGNYAAGGAGGSFGGLGGHGGDTLTATGGVPIAVQPADDLRGGCAGGAGGDSSGSGGGKGGVAGGAIAVLATLSITLVNGNTPPGSINARGDGGGGGSNGSGGGGGGASGGMIVFETINVLLEPTTSLEADGGGGGGGGLVGVPGSPGQDEDASNGARATGGAGGGAGSGGASSGSGDLTGSDGTSTSTAAGGAAGGGGGGAGVIRLFTMGVSSSGAVISPPSS